MPDDRFRRRRCGEGKPIKSHTDQPLCHVVQSSPSSSPRLKQTAAAACRARPQASKPVKSRFVASATTSAILALISLPIGPVVKP